MDPATLDALPLPACVCSAADGSLFMSNGPFDEAGLGGPTTRAAEELRLAAVARRPVRVGRGETTFDLRASPCTWHGVPAIVVVAYPVRAGDERFVPLVSHELKTPLTSLLLWSRLLREGRLTADAEAEAKAAVERSAVTLTRLVDDLLDAARLSAGMVRILKAPVDMAGVVDLAADRLREKARERGVTIRVEHRSEAAVEGDAKRLGQAVGNVLSNAVEFSPPGGEVTAMSGRRGEYVEVVVRDEGPGLPGEISAGGFEAFRQSDRSDSRTHGGLGLGLSIAHGIVGLHGGTVEAGGVVEAGGASFTVRLPAAGTLKPVAATGDPPGVTAAPAGRLDGKRVLLAEDEPDTRLAVTAVLEEAGAEVTAVSSAAEALAALSPDGTRPWPDLLMSDIAMPGGDGYRLIRRVRQLEREMHDAALPALALTAFSDDDDERHALEAGFHSHVAKPVRAAELVDAAARLTGRR